MTTPPTSGPDHEDGDADADADAVVNAEPSDQSTDAADAADASEPASARRLRPTRSTTTLIVACVLLVAFVVAAATRSVPYVSLGPGPTFNTIGEYDGKPLITVTGHRTYPTSGHLDLTTVSESGGPYGRLGLGEAIRGWIDPHVAVVPTKLLYPPGQKSDQVQKQAAADFTDAEDSATIASFKYLGIPFQYVVKVSTIEPGSAASGNLETNDVIVSIDGTKVSSTEAARTLIQKTKSGDTISVVVNRDGKDKTVVLKPKLKTEDGKSVPVVGVTLGTDYTSDVTVKYSLTGVGGPSAGLMFSLGLTDMLTPTSINFGKYVAGTGTIDADGKVGPIGGIQQKMVGARGNGATIFLVPADNCAAAKNAVPKGLTIAKVTSLTSAIAALKTINSGGTPPPC